MAHFRGIVQGQRGEGASRLGNTLSGITVEAQSWDGKVVTKLFRRNNADMARVTIEPHQGRGESHLLYEGPVNPDARPEIDVEQPPVNWKAARAIRKIIDQVNEIELEERTKR